MFAINSNEPWTHPLMSWVFVFVLRTSKGSTSLATGVAKCAGCSSHCQSPAGIQKMNNMISTIYVGNEYRELISGLNTPG
jgi:hypothetical protein